MVLNNYRRALFSVLIVAAFFAVPSIASADPSYGVQNASGGIYWRSGPDWNTAEATAGNGFYPGTVITIHCYQAGAANVPGSTDGMWEQASWASGPGTGSGWINEHFINDGAGINQPSPGVPACPTGGGTGGGSTGGGSTGGGGSLPPDEFAVQNASGGIYWRSGPDWNTAEATAGSGVFPGTVIGVYCYQAGAANVPGSTDGMWEQASWASGPGTGSGWINEHFINDGAGINRPSPGIPACSGNGSSAPPRGTTPPISRSSSSPAPTEQILPPDPDAWCATYGRVKGFGTQITEDGWTVIPTGLQGTAGKNNWACKYLVQMTTGGTVKNDTFTVPLDVTRTWPVDFADVCRTQFPGSYLRWDASRNFPWVCVGQAGKYYPPFNVTREYLLNHGGYVADGLGAPSAGTIRVAVTAPTGSAVAASTRSRLSRQTVLIASGYRDVRRRGHYTVEIALTRRGRRLLRHNHRLQVTTRVTFASKTGHKTVRLSGRYVVRA